MKILVTGSRQWKDEQKIYDALVAAHRFLDQIGIEFGIPTMIHGDADGADKIAAKTAYDLGWEVWGVPYNYEKHKGDPRNRNTELVEEGADLCIAFYIKPTGARKGGTRDCYEKAIDAGILTWVIQ